MVPHDSKSDLPLTTISVMCNADSVVSKHEELASEKILSHCECVGGVFLKLLLRVRRIAFANTHIQNSGNTMRSISTCNFCFVYNCPRQEAKPFQHTASD